MLEHQKIVLENVSSDVRLFKKEIYKSLSWLEPSEIEEFKSWLVRRFNRSHAEILLEVFPNLPE